MTESASSGSRGRIARGLPAPRPRWTTGAAGTDTPHPDGPLRLGGGGGHPDRRGGAGHLRPDRFDPGPGRGPPGHHLGRRGGQLTSVPRTTFDAVGATTTPPIPLQAPTVLAGQPPLAAHGRPEVLFVGAEFCPFCAAERWPLIVALSRFGHFGRLYNMQSAPQSVFPGIQTFTFWGTTYTSRYVTLTGVELYSDGTDADGSFARLDTLDAAQQAVLDRYRGAGTSGPAARRLPVRGHRQQDGGLHLGVQPGAPGPTSPRGPSPVTWPTPRTRPARPSWRRPTSSRPASAWPRANSRGAVCSSKGVRARRGARG